MLKEILELFKKEDLLKQAMDEANEMFNKAEFIFKAAMEMVTSCKESNVDIYEIDQEIDDMELDVRQKAIKHLILNSRKEDVAATIVLTDAVRDIERIGDYSKSIYELLDICPTEFIVGSEGLELLENIESQILEIFALTREANRDGDIQKAKKVMEMQLEIGKECDKIFVYMSLKPDLKNVHAVIYVLLSRYLKRISSHIKNIATNIVNPFQRTDLK
ncbi:TPA: hypothetical protein ENS27_18505 [bacterium]|nr:hypothetical protein [bacterium]